MVGSVSLHHRSCGHVWRHSWTYTMWVERQVQVQPRYKSQFTSDYTVTLMWEPCQARQAQHRRQHPLNVAEPPACRSMHGTRDASSQSYCPCEAKWSVPARPASLENQPTFPHCPSPTSAPIQLTSIHISTSPYAIKYAHFCQGCKNKQLNKQLLMKMFNRW